MNCPTAPTVLLEMFLDEQCWFSELEGSHSGMELEKHQPVLCKFTETTSICDACLAPDTRQYK